MYLRKLRVRNIKLLRDVELDFTRDGEPRLWTVLIGENGLCKTALLQAIALAASGPDRANQLADVPSLRDVRHPDEPAEIEAEFGFGEHGHAGREYPGLPSRPATPPRLVSRLWIEPGWKVFQGESRSTSTLPTPTRRKTPCARRAPGGCQGGSRRGMAPRDLCRKRRQAGGPETQSSVALIRSLVAVSLPQRTLLASLQGIWLPSSKAPCCSYWPLTIAYCLKRRVCRSVLWATSQGLTSSRSLTVSRTYVAAKMLNQNS